MFKMKANGGEYLWVTQTVVMDMAMVMDLDLAGKDC